VDVTVVGAGVVGLTTALVLEERGHRVRIVASGTDREITSSLAGAVWFPYHVGPPAKVNAWAARTREWLTSLAGSAPESGVDLLTFFEITADASEPWWAGSLPQLARAAAPVTGAPEAWTFSAPRAEPALFLPWLAKQLRAPIERRRVQDFIAEPGDALVDCTGLAARELFGDAALVPLFGQTLICELGGCDPAITITDARDDDAHFYVIPRRDELVVGGCSIAVPPGTAATPDPAITARIMRQANELGVPIGAIKTVRAGLRPFRPEVRLERDARAPRIVHNYGHGGAGFTLCRGCAEAVAALLT
jgi:D-amino-acid oxidase